MKRNWSARSGAPSPAATALAVFVVSFATLLGAWYFQFVLKFAPCPLCLEQRIPYYVVIPLSLLLTIAAARHAPRAIVAGGFVVILVAAACGTALGTYHAGVEWHFWPGPSDCSGPLGALNSGGSLLEQLNSVHVVRCDQAAWRFLGISLAGYNVLISLAMAVLALYGLLACRHSAASLGLAIRRPRQKDLH
ncbi:MAG: disulfide bond formation protein B [Xanthobacteraceae bacterium]